MTSGRRADSAWKDALSRDGVFLTTTVLVELAWVLRRAAKFDRHAVVASLRFLCDSEGVEVEHDLRCRRALDRFEAGQADFSDCLILETARENVALPVVTFDQRFARDADVQLVP